MPIQRNYLLLLFLPLLLLSLLLLLSSLSLLLLSLSLLLVVVSVVVSYVTNTSSSGERSSSSHIQYLRNHDNSREENTIHTWLLTLIYYTFTVFLSFEVYHYGIVVHKLKENSNVVCNSFKPYCIFFFIIEFINWTFFLKSVVRITYFLFGFYTATETLSLKTNYLLLSL